MELGVRSNININFLSDGININISASPLISGGRSTSTPVPKTFKTRIPILETPASTKKLPLVKIEENTHHDKNTGYSTIDDEEDKENIKKVMENHHYMQGLKKRKTSNSGVFTSSAGSNVDDESGEKKAKSNKKRRSLGFNVTPKRVSKAPKLLTAMRAEVKKNRTPAVPSILEDSTQGFSTDSNTVKKCMTEPQKVKKKKNTSKKNITIPRTPKFVRRYYLTHPQEKK